MSSNRLEGDKRFGYAYRSGQRNLHTRKTTLNGSDSDVTTDDDEFILYINDDKTHIIK